MLAVRMMFPLRKRDSLAPCRGNAYSERGSLSARLAPSRYPYEHTTLRHFARQQLAFPTCLQLEKGGPDVLRLRPLPTVPLNFLENRLKHPLMTGNLQRPCVAYMVKFLT